MVKKDFRRTSQWGKVRRVAIATKEPYCYLCGNYIDDSVRSGPLSMEVDHVIPLSRGGDPFDIDNLMLTHKVCNQIKGSSLANERVEKRATTTADSILEFDTTYLDWLDGEQYEREE